MNPAAAYDFDVVIVGGGMAGLLCAGLLSQELQQKQRRIALLEPRPPQPVSNATDIDLRVSALSPVSADILRRAGIWQELPEEKVCPYEAMQVWHASGKAHGARSISFDAAGMGVPALGYIVENRAVRQTAWQQLTDSGQVSLLSGAELTDFRSRDQGIELEFADGNRLTAALLVGADGVSSRVREGFAAGFTERSYRQAAVVAHIRTARHHDYTAWQRFLPGGPVAMLPLADGRCSLVWSCPEERAAELLTMENAEFDQALTEALDGALGRVQCTGKRVSFPLAMGYSPRYTGQRYALIGDAAHRIHPLAGQGANLGLLDAAELARILGLHLQHPLADPGDPVALRKYERARKGDNLITMGLMDLLNRVFSSPLGDLAGRSLEWVDRSEAIKSYLAAYAMGRDRLRSAAAQPAAQNAIK